MGEENHLFVCVGGWDRHKSPPGNGLAMFRFDAETGEMHPVTEVAPQITVGAVCLGVGGSTLYCTDEYDTLPGNFLGGGGQVYAFAIDRDDGTLAERSRGPSFGSMPSHLAVEPSGRFLIVTHHTDRTPITRVEQDGGGAYRIALAYDDATTVLFRLTVDGSVGAPVDVHIHSGDGGPLPRQTHPQLHCVMASPSGDLFAVTDKGNDEIWMFEIDAAAGKLRPCGAPFRSVPGSSPRYLAFHPTGPWLFVNHETKAIVTVLRYTTEGIVEHVQTVDVLPPDIADNFDMKQSDIVVHPHGGFLYTLVRGISAVSVFAIVTATGHLRLVQTVTLDGVGPRACAVSPDGRFLVIAALVSHEVLVWRIADDGTVSPSGTRLSRRNAGTVTFLRDLRIGLRARLETGRSPQEPEPGGSPGRM